jgi:hypothetical protein
MFTESTTGSAENQSQGIFSARVLAGLAAIVVTALLLGGYAILRRRHAARNVAAAAVPAPVTTGPKGPAKVHVLVDDPMLKAGQTLLGGTVKNVSSEPLTGLAIEMELRRRKDGEVELMLVELQPASLGAGEEARYGVTLPAQQYGSVRLAGVRENQSGLLAYTSGSGQKRPLERTESKTIIVRGGRSGSRNEEFINSPDNPMRVP